MALVPLTKALAPSVVGLVISFGLWNVARSAWPIPVSTFDYDWEKKAITHTAREAGTPIALNPLRHLQ